MKRALILSMCVFLFACGGDDGDEETTDESPATEQEVETEDAAAPEGVLQPEEVPAGWTEAPDIVEQVLNQDGPCTVPLQTSGRPSVGYRESDNGPWVVHLAGPVDDPAARVAELQARVGECAEFQDEGAISRWEQVEAPALGEETVAVNVRREGDPTLPLSASVVFTRQGDELSSLVVLAASGDPDPALVDDLAQKAAAHL